ncbi:hypothetical protein [Rhizobium lusitanum]|uniref:hypothetical protein n=1 Tax=Rhizobium lusitanum TaxID=293958 RepID=UPI001574BBB5|nr:hypothetical protein [Rhizobium lusitanum]NTJ11588.1 hypothetical protein [Rhizobium lusitanum]
MTRYPALELEHLTPRQREILPAVVAGQSDTLNRFYRALMHSPELAERLQHLMAYLQSGLRLPEPLRALAVLVAATKHCAEDARFFLEMADIKDAILPSDISRALIDRRKPDNMTADQEIVYDFCTQVRSNGRVDNVTFERAAARFGREVCLEIGILMGSVACMSMLVNVVEM